MPMRLLNEECQIMNVEREINGKNVIFMFCKTKQAGLPCPRDAKGGKKPSELSASCFEVMSETDFLRDIIMPDLLKQSEKKPNQKEVVKDGGN